MEPTTGAWCCSNPDPTQTQTQTLTQAQTQTQTQTQTLALALTLALTLTRCMVLLDFQGEVNEAAALSLLREMSLRQIARPCDTPGSNPRLAGY